MRPALARNVVLLGVVSLLADVSSDMVMPLLPAFLVSLLAASTAADRLAEAFAFHRGMDHAGAALGPLVAAGLLVFWPGDLRRVFLLAAIPGALAVLALFAVREQAS